MASLIALIRLTEPSADRLYDMPSRRARIFAASLLSLLLISACSRNEDTKAIATQVAAKVNSDEITVHQINYRLAHSKYVKPEAVAQAKRTVLEALINQQLAKQKAIETQLDRSPNVVQAIEATRAQILAQAYLNGIARTLSKPTAVEVDAYYSKHPELFQQRRVFFLEQIIVEGNAAVAASLRKQLPVLGSIEDVTNWLQSQDVKFNVNRGARTAEQIPLEILPQVAAMKKGEIRLFESRGGGFQLIKLLDFMAAPMDETAAKPYIEQFLYNQGLTQAIATEMSELRKQATIEYMGEFADRKAAVEGNPETPSQK